MVEMIRGTSNISEDGWFDEEPSEEPYMGREISVKKSYMPSMTFIEE